MSIDDVVDTSNQVEEASKHDTAQYSNAGDSIEMQMELDINNQSKYEHLLTLQGFKRGLSSLSISPDGSKLASVGADGLLKVWSLATGAVLATLDAIITLEEEEPEEVDRLRLGLNDVAWSKDGRYLVSGGDACVVQVWDTKTYTLSRQFTGHTSFVFCVAFHPNSTLTVSGSFDETVRLWNLPRNTCHRTISAHSEAVTAVDFNLDGSILASGSYDGLIRLWDSYTGQCLKTLVYGEAPPVGNISFSPNSFQLLATFLDNTIRLWDIANSRVVKTYTGHQNEKFAIKASFTAYTNEKKQANRHEPFIMVVAGSEDHKVYLWDLQSRKVVQTLPGHRDAIVAIATHPAQHIIASASLERDPCIKIWRLNRE